MSHPYAARAPGVVSDRDADAAGRGHRPEVQHGEGCEVDVLALAADRRQQGVSYTVHRTLAFIEDEEERFAVILTPPKARPGGHLTTPAGTWGTRSRRRCHRGRRSARFIPGFDGLVSGSAVLLSPGAVEPSRSSTWRRRKQPVPWGWATSQGKSLPVTARISSWWTVTRSWISLP